MVLSYAVTDFPDEPRKVRDPKYPCRCRVLAIDILRAYFNAVTRDDEPTYLELPPEVEAAAGTCALLKRHMYGTQRAADGWQSEYSGTLRGLGFAQGSAIVDSRTRQLETAARPLGDSINASTGDSPKQNLATVGASTINVDGRGCLECAC